jgi:DNA-binding CsgD family transcriptional regulator
VVLYGRGREQAALAALLAGARQGRSGVLVLRGEAGIGKSALLDWAAARLVTWGRSPQAGEPHGGVRADEAGGFRVLRVTGIEAETELAFAGLVELLWPVRERISRLPAPQREALLAVLGTETVRGDRFLVGVAMLSLLAELAAESPVLCLVDDAQWLDRATTDALVFVARRLAAEGVAMVFATRDAGTAQGLADLRLGRLEREDAGRLLDAYPLTAESRERVLVESAGNPLALAEFAAAVPHGSAAGPLPVAERVAEAFQAQIEALPEGAGVMLLVAAADVSARTSGRTPGSRDLAAVLTAGRELGAGLAELQEAERARLISVGDGELTFRHPLIATAAYQRAPLALRIAAHRALADTTADPDVRAAHLPAVTLAADESAAAELVAAAERAQARSACPAVATLYGQAARVTPDPGSRAVRLARAATAALSAGDVDRAVGFATRARGIDRAAATAARVREAGQAHGVMSGRAEAAMVLAAVEFERGDPAGAAVILLDDAGRAPREMAVSMMRIAADYAWFAGAPRLVRVAAARLEELGGLDAGTRGLAEMIAGRYADGVRLLGAFEADAVAVGGDGDPARAGRRYPEFADGEFPRARAVHLSWIAGDDARTLELSAENVARLRGHGLIGALPDALQELAKAQVVAGLHRDAHASVAEAAAIARDTGARQRSGQLDTVLARIAAIEGDEARCRELVKRAGGTGQVAAETMLGLLDLGLGRPEEALARLLAARRGPAGHAGVLMAATGDLVEAAVKAGRPEQAAEPLASFGEWARAGGRPWALAVLERGLAQVGEGDPEGHFRRAVHLHEGATRPFERARTELAYGEWLRRERRRGAAREPLRSALRLFERLRAAPWAERARDELRVTGGGSARPAADLPLDRLTPQELQVVRLAARGAGSREIAERLFLSPRTVQYHLYKAYPKLGIGSRRELAGLDL